jgi:hypothetical protein
MARTIGDLAAEARVLLNDVIPISGSPRFSDADLAAALNDAVVQIRTKRPDAFLRYGLRRVVPTYTLPTDADAAFPVDDMFYAPVLYYVVGRSELVEDTFSDDGRAISLMNKFVSQLLKVAS